MNKTTLKFDFEEGLEALKSGRDLNGKDGLLTPLICKYPLNYYTS